MSTIYNEVSLIGRLGADPQSRQTDRSVMSRFSIAVDEVRKDANGEIVKNAQWFSVVAFGNVAERVHKFLKKGTKVVVKGSLHNNEWTDRDGTKHTSTEIILDEFYFMS